MPLNGSWFLLMLQIFWFSKVYWFPFPKFFRFEMHVLIFKLLTYPWSRLKKRGINSKKFLWMLLKLLLFSAESNWDSENECIWRKYVFFEVNANFNQIGNNILLFQYFGQSSFLKFLRELKNVRKFWLAFRKYQVNKTNYLLSFEKFYEHNNKKENQGR